MYDCPKCGADLFKDSEIQKLEGSIVECPKCGIRYRIVLEYTLTATLVELGEHDEL